MLVAPWSPTSPDAAVAAFVGGGRLPVAVAKHRPAGADIAVADGGEEVVEGVELEFPCQLEEAIVLDRVQGGLAKAAALLVEHLPPPGDVLLPALLLEPAADLLPGARGLDEVEPVARGTVGGLGGQD